LEKLHAVQVAKIGNTGFLIIFVFFIMSRAFVFEDAACGGEDVWRHGVEWGFFFGHWRNVVAVGVGVVGLGAHRGLLGRA